MTNKDFYLAPWWVRKRSHQIRLKIASWALMGALIGLSMLLAWVAIGCGSVTQSGYVRAGLYPRHNEAVDGLSGRIVKERIEVSEAVRLGRFELVVNPNLQFENRWPEGSYTYSWNTVMLETNFEGRVYLIEPVYLFYRKTDHRLLRNDGGSCLCTYWNELGLEWRW